MRWVLSQLRSHTTDPGSKSAHYFFYSVENESEDIILWNGITIFNERCVTRSDLILNSNSIYANYSSNCQLLHCTPHKVAHRLTHCLSAINGHHWTIAVLQCHSSGLNFFVTNVKLCWPVVVVVAVFICGIARHAKSRKRLLWLWDSANENITSGRGHERRLRATGEAVVICNNDSRVSTPDTEPFNYVWLQTLFTQCLHLLIYSQWLQRLLSPRNYNFWNNFTFNGRQ